MQASFSYRNFSVDSHRRSRRRYYRCLDLFTSSSSSPEPEDPGADPGIYVPWGRPVLAMETMVVLNIPESLPNSLLDMLIHILMAVDNY